MSLRVSITVVLAVLLLSSVTTVWGMDYSQRKTVRNEGAAAMGVAVQLEGHTGIAAHEGGGPHADADFLDFDTYPDYDPGLVTWLKWRIFDDGEADYDVDTGQTVSVAWTIRLEEGESFRHFLRRMWWTDISGSPLPDREIYNLTIYPIEPLYPKIGKVRIPNPWDEAIFVEDIQYAVLTDPLPLEDLHTQNPILQEALEHLPGGSEVPLAPGEADTLSLPEPIPQGSTLVMSYECWGFGPGAQRAVDLVQFNLCTGPTQTQSSTWGRMKNLYR